MPAPRHRSRKLIRKKRRVPGGRLVTRYTKKKPKKPQCTSCGKKLAGISFSTTKSKKQPQRPHGGVLCFNCLQQQMMEKARQQ